VLTCCARVIGHRPGRTIVEAAARTGLPVWLGFTCRLATIGDVSVLRGATLSGLSKTAFGSVLRAGSCSAVFFSGPVMHSEYQRDPTVATRHPVLGRLGLADRLLPRVRRMGEPKLAVRYLTPERPSPRPLRFGLTVRADSSAAAVAFRAGHIGRLPSATRPARWGRDP